MNWQKFSLFLLGVGAFLCLVGQGSAATRQGQQLAVVKVDGGKLSDFQWAVALASDGGEHGGQRPCVLAQLIDLASPGGPNDFARERMFKACSPLTKTVPPNIVSLSVGEGKDEVSVFGMAFVPAIASVSLDFGSEGVTRVKLKELNDVQRRNAGLRSVRYAAFARVGPACLRQVTGFSKAGSMIYQGPVDECPGS